MEPEARPETQPQVYRVQLPVFEGPIDLLLRLIEQRQLAVTAVSLASVADQYLEHIRSLDEQDGAELASFVEVAARLLLIKSRLLLPVPAAEEDEEEGDLAGDLVRRLQDYRRYRQAADWLAQRRCMGLSLYAREPTLPDEPTAVLQPSSPHKLAEALERALAQV